nr:MAG TPA: hypothetical protein [Caudoviricetes sp.]
MKQRGKTMQIISFYRFYNIGYTYTTINLVN